MEFVYLLWHTHEMSNGEEDVKLIGVYSSESIAEGKIDIYKDLPGFRDSQGGFEISKYKMDDDCWQEGFVEA